MSEPTLTNCPIFGYHLFALTEIQCDKLLKSAEIDEDNQCWLFVLFALHTAMRHSEILSARFDNIDFTLARLHIPEAKAGMREQPLTKELVRILKIARDAAEEPDGWVFPTPRPNASKNGHRYRMNLPFKRSVIRAGMDPKLITPHVLRHTAITKLVKAGVDLLTIQKISGHKSLEMIQRYSHVHGDHIDKAISALDVKRNSLENEDFPDTVTQELHIK